MSKPRNLTILWFLMGLGSRTQILFSLSIAECMVLLMFPFCLMTGYHRFRRNGILFFFWLAVALFISCACSSLYNQCDFQQTIRGLSVCGLILAAIPVSFWMLSADFKGVKWLFVGATISLWLSTFIFQSSVEKSMYGSAEDIMNGPLFWISRLSDTLTVPCRGWYLSVPHAYSWGVALFIAVFAIMTSASGRSSAIVALGVAAICFLGGRTRKSIKKFSRKFWLYFILAILGAFILNKTYAFLALNGYLSEKAQQKYELQTRGNKGIMALLIGGRADSFVGLMACIDKPILGFGPWAKDDGSYNERFLAKYGNADDYEEYVKRRESEIRNGKGLRLISCHSYITMFWLWCGAVGLFFMLYYGFVVVRFIKDDCYVAPRWFFWLAAGTVGIMWNLFFSPFDARVALPRYVVAVLMIRAIRLGKSDLPYHIREQICGEFK